MRRRDGDAWLAGGTWLFSRPQPHLRRLVDLSRMHWPPLVVTEAGLDIAATCTIAQLDEAVLPASWIAATLIGQCCRALVASFKICNVATVGGNVCLALPAGAMISLIVALDGIATIWMTDGRDRGMPVVDLVAGAGTNAMRPEEVLRSIHIPAEALMRRAAFRRIALSPQGRSAALLIGTLTADAGFRLTVTASTPRPIQLSFDAVPKASELAQAIEQAVPTGRWFNDMHGAPDWRRHVTLLLAEEIRDELAGLS